MLLAMAAMALTLAGCATAPRPVDPRTLTFAPLTFNIPKSERVTLANGMVVYLLEDHELPLVNLTAYVQTGSIYEPAEKAGLAGIAGAVMRSGGTTALQPEQLDAELEFMASSVESGIGAEVGNVSLATLRKNLDRTLELFGQVLMTPAFREDRVTLAKNQSIEAIRRQNDDPKGIAERELMRALYAGHPLGRVPTIGNISAISRDDLVAFHRRYFRPAGIMLAVSGDFRKDELVAKLNQLFAGWQPGPLDLPAVAQPAASEQPAVLLARKSVSQSVIRLGRLGVDKNSPDIYALRVMDYILGGGFTSRLTNEIRSNLGLAYHAGSRVDIGRRFAGTIVADTETKTESTARVIGLIKQLMGGMTAAPVTDQELDLAKNALINSFIFGFVRVDAVVNQQARLEFFGYPPNYLENYRDNLARVTKDDVLRVARTYLTPERFTLMVVGNDKGFDQPLGSFGAVKEIVLENGDGPARPAMKHKH
jgi:predicted Zn-dependent peptidase